MRLRLHGIATLALIVTAIGTLLVGTAAATPNSDGVVFNLRIFNDNPGSIVTTTNAYPSSVVISDVGGLSGGFANLHNWHMATGGVEDVFNNPDAFSLCATMTISGEHNAEAGLQLSPWWSQQVDGRLNVRVPDGEIACFGGRLPFYSFTASQGVVYTKGNAIHLTIVYLPNGLSAASPATIEYRLIYEGTFYTSGPLPFDQGNPAEDPPHGLWGCLNDARLGGFVQAFVMGDPFFATGTRVEFTNICYTNLGPVPDATTTWGQIKNLYSE
jgi:hypothetical protein